MTDPTSEAPTRKRRKPRDRPLLIVITGHGKGKSTSAFGMLHALVGARLPLRRLPVRQVRQVEGRRGEGRAGARRDRLGEDGRRLDVDLTDLDESADKAREGWAEVKRRIEAERYEFLLLDELTYAIKYGWIAEDEIVSTLRDRPGFQHVVVTGRDAPPGLIEAADLVSEVVKIKHPMDAGIRAQQGIEW